VKPGKYPKTEKDMFKVLSLMQSHSSYCLSGGRSHYIKTLFFVTLNQCVIDNTLDAVSKAIESISKGPEEADDYFVLVLSDANITQYNIQPNALFQALNKKKEKVHAYMVFIGSLQDQALRLTEALPGKAFMCMDTSMLPRILQNIFVQSVLGQV
jgi:von Willebrand factor A domain-containing protein 8